MQIDAQEFGQMKATVEHLSNSVDKLERAVDGLTGVIAELQGGKKFLFGLITAVAGVAGVVGYFTGFDKK